MKYEIILWILEKYNLTDWGLVNIDEIKELKDCNIEHENLPYELYYLKKPQRKSITAYWKDAKSVIVCLYQYWNNEKDYDRIISEIKEPYNFLSKKYKNIEHLKNIKKERFKIARYALVDEYHKKIKENNTKILAEIKSMYPDVEGKIFVDTSPIYEKNLAYLCGLGFIGKNTLLISEKYGSYVFISGIITNRPIEGKTETKLSKTTCGSCDRCIKACPTKALNEYKLNPHKCISFWTTHTKNKTIPNEIINASDYIFGCDICQEVCPFNSKIKKGKTIF